MERSIDPPSLTQHGQDIPIISHGSHSRQMFFLPESPLEPVEGLCGEPNPPCPPLFFSLPQRWSVSCECGKTRKEAEDGDSSRPDGLNWTEQKRELHSTWKIPEDLNQNAKPPRAWSSEGACIDCSDSTRVYFLSALMRGGLPRFRLVIQKSDSLTPSDDAALRGCPASFCALRGMRPPIREIQVKRPNEKATRDYMRKTTVVWCFRVHGRATAIS